MGLAVRVLLVGAALVAIALPVDADAHNALTGHGAQAGLVLAARVTPPAHVLRASAPRDATVTPRCSAGLVALTFDDGPAPVVTPRLLQVLQDHHVPATFFMVGSRVRRSPRVARKVARAGFTVGNHTWSHPQLTQLPDRTIRQQLRSTARELRRAGVPSSTLMRPPYGDIDPRVSADVHDLGLVPVLWNVDSGDWRGGSARQIADSILGQLRPHRDNVVLQHDGVRNSPASVAAVPRVVREGRRRGYCFGRLGPHGHVLAPGADVAASTRVASAAPRSGPRVVETPFTAVLDRAGAHA